MDLLILFFSVNIGKVECVNILNFKNFMTLKGVIHQVCHAGISFVKF